MDWLLPNMKCLWGVIVFFLGTVQVFAQAKPAPPRGPFSTKSFSEGGGFSAPSQEASNAMEYGAWQEGGVDGILGPVAPAPLPPKPRPHAPISAPPSPRDRIA